MQETIFQQLWEKNKEKLAQFIRANVREKSETDDILQETYLQGLSQFTNLREQEKFTAWIFSISRNYMYQYFRNRNKFLIHSEEEWEMLSVQPNVFSEEKNLSDLAEQCLARLGDYSTLLEGNISHIQEFMRLQLPDFEKIRPEYIEAWVECDIKKVPQQIFANKKGISLSAAKSRVQRAREKIKKVLMNCCFFEFDVRGSVVNYTPLGERKKCALERN